jgi:hypothetical protein
MSARLFITLVGVTAVVAAFLALTGTVRLDATDSKGYQIECGSPATPDLSMSRRADQEQLQSRLGQPNLEKSCEDKLSGPRVWAIPLGVIGLIALLAALAMKIRWRSTERSAGR